MSRSKFRKIITEEAHCTLLDIIHLEGYTWEDVLLLERAPDDTPYEKAAIQTDLPSDTRSDDETPYELAGPEVRTTKKVPKDDAEKAEGSLSKAWHFIKKKLPKWSTRAGTRTAKHLKKHIPKMGGQAVEKGLRALPLVGDLAILGSDLYQADALPGGKPVDVEDVWGAGGAFAGGVAGDIAGPIGSIVGSEVGDEAARQLYHQRQRQLGREEELPTRVVSYDRKGNIIPDTDPRSAHPERDVSSIVPPTWMEKFRAKRLAARDKRLEDFYRNESVQKKSNILSESEKRRFAQLANIKEEHTRPLNEIGEFLVGPAIFAFLTAAFIAKEVITTKLRGRDRYPQPYNKFFDDAGDVIRQRVKQEDPLMLNFVREMQRKLSLGKFWKQPSTQEIHAIMVEFRNDRNVAELVQDIAHSKSAEELSSLLEQLENYISLSLEETVGEEPEI
jgi:hypothetical protein